jgi:hypothetical protein
MSAVWSWLVTSAERTVPGPAKRRSSSSRWTAWLGVVGAVAHVALLASFVVSEGFFSLEGQVITAIPATLFIWIVGTGIGMLATEH